MRTTKSTQDIFPNTISTTNILEFHLDAAIAATTATTTAVIVAALQTSHHHLLPLLQYPLGLQSELEEKKKVI